MNTMKKRIVLCLGIIFVLLVVGMTLFDVFGWRLFQFKFCSSPQGIGVTELTAQDNIYHIKAEPNSFGSFSNPLYNGIIYTYHDGVLRIGIHEGIINGQTIIDESFEVAGEVTKILLCGEGKEQALEFTSTK